MPGQVKGIVKIQRQFVGGGVRAGSEKSKLIVTFLVEVSAGEHDGEASNIHHWLKEEDILQQPNFVVEKATVVLLKDVSKKLREGVAAFPAEILECIATDSSKKRAEKRRETDKIGERPQLVRAKSLEDQMLQQSGYGTKGKL